MAGRGKGVWILGYPGFFSGFAFVIDVGPDEEVFGELDDFAGFGGGAEGEGEEAVVIGEAEGAGGGWGGFVGEAGGGVLEG